MLYGTDGDTSEEEVAEKNRRRISCPVLEVEIGGCMEQALIGTGAQISAIDRKKPIEVQGWLDIPVLPVLGLNVEGAFGARFSSCSSLRKTQDRRNLCPIRFQ